MNGNTMFVSLADGVVISSGHEHPEPRPVPGAVVKPWNACTIPGCSHGPCPGSCGPGPGMARPIMLRP